MTLRSLLTNAAALFSLAAFAGCAFMPQHFALLDEARAAHAAAAADPQILRYAASELGQAHDTLELALTARATLQDPALVDHLAYIARQRVAIAREAASLRAASFTSR